MSWEIRQIQVVWFAATAAEKQAGTLFHAAFRQAPQQTQSNNIPNPTMPFLSVATETENQLIRSVQVQPGRIDLAISVRPEGGLKAVVGALPIKSAFSGVLGPATGLSKELAGQVSRISFVLMVAQPVSSASDAYQVVNHEFGDPIKFSDGSDLQIQVNRRISAKSIRTKNVLINRVIRMGAAFMQNIEMHTALRSDIIPSPIRVTEEHFVDYVLDINTVPRADTYTSEEMASLFNEMAQIAESLLNAPGSKGLSS